MLRGGLWVKRKLSGRKLLMRKSGGNTSHTVGIDGSIKEGLRRSFAEKANEFSLLLDTISLTITKFEGALDVSFVLDGLILGSIRPGGTYKKWTVAYSISSISSQKT